MADPLHRKAGEHVGCLCVMSLGSLAPWRLVSGALVGKLVCNTEPFFTQEPVLQILEGSDGSLHSDGLQLFGFND